MRGSKSKYLALALMALSLAGMVATFVTRIMPISTSPPRQISETRTDSGVLVELKGSRTFIQLPTWIPLTSIACAAFGIGLWANSERSRPAKR